MGKSRSYCPSFAFFGVTSPFDQSFAFVTSPLPFLHPLALGVVRALFAVYALTTLVVLLALQVNVYGSSSSYLSYFTNLSYIGQCAYFSASSVQTIAFAHTLRKLRHVQTDGHKEEGSRRCRDYPLQRWPRALQFLHLWLYTSVMVYPILVTIVFWALLTTDQTFSTSHAAWGNISKHALNSVFVIFEICGTNVPPLSWSYLVPACLPLALYLGLAYITHATQKFYTYSFLDPSVHHGFVAVYVIGITLGYCIVFVIVKGLLTLRCRAWLRREQSKEGRSPSAPLAEWEMIEDGGEAI